MSKVVFLGPQGTFTHQACLSVFHDSELSYQLSIQDIFACIEHNKADFGVVPIENSIEGMVTHALDSLLMSDLKVYQEIHLQIQHHLYTKNNSQLPIKRIVTHPQAFAQCKQYLKQYYPDVTSVLAPSTSRAIEMMLEEPHTAAIAGKQIVDYYDLVCLQENIQDKDNNTTRFLVISKQERAPTGHDKTSLMLALDNKPGTLVNILSPFSLLNINLTKIESRPEPGKIWSNLFFVDLLGHIDDAPIQVALQVLETIGVQVKHLGSYPCLERLPCS